MKVESDHGHWLGQLVHDTGLVTKDTCPTKENQR
jgi:hypothetical protein